jgi:uncharacterized surface protein with fasciclin (FAS1) repeats
MHKTLFRSWALALISLFVVACDSDNNNRPAPTPAPEPPPVVEEGPGTIAEVAAEAGSFSTLIAALEATGLDATVADESATLTVFAPTDDAFAKLPEGTLDALLNDTDTLSDILLYHVIAGQAVGAETALSLAGTTVEMANGDIVALTIRDGNLFINESLVTATDIEASNGVIHVIDTVLLPPDDAEPAGSIVDIALATEDLTTLVSAVTAAGLVETLADETATFTVFAPTNAAFAAVGEETLNALLADTEALTNVLLYHVVSGAAIDSITATAALGQMVEMANGDSVTVDIREGELFINDSQVVIKDIPATNGIVHVIDTVLLPPADAAQPGNIVEVAVADGRFTTLVAAVEAAGLADTLSDAAATFTVFAPTDAAFEALGQATIDDLLADPEALSNVLLYHVISGSAVPAEDALALAGSNVTMANGDDVTLTVQDGALFINESQVIVTDVQASNGIIHAIDAVLLPPM